MSKIITYTLEADGTVPEYVSDGGYFPAESGLPSPQDWTFIGVASDDAPGETFANAASVEAYFLSIGGESWTDPDGVPVDLAQQAQAIWDKMLTWG